MNTQTLEINVETINYVRVRSGRDFYVANPRAEDITMDDIAHSLSNLCRFTGHAERFYSVGEHSILCAMVGKVLGYSTLEQLYCLFHDASESVMNDLAKPVKNNVPQYCELEDKVMDVMWEVAKLPKPNKEQYKKVKHVDNIMLINEMKQLMNREVTVQNVEPMFVALRIGMGAGESKVGFLETFDFLYKEYLKELDENGK